MKELICISILSILCIFSGGLFAYMASRYTPRRCCNCKFYFYDDTLSDCQNLHIKVTPIFYCANWEKKE